MTRIELLCDVLNNQRNLTKWYIKKIPQELLAVRLELNGIKINSPLWTIGHLIWTDYTIGLLPLGFKEQPASWVNKLAYKSSGELPDALPSVPEILDLFNAVHDKKLNFFRSLDDKILDCTFSIESLGFRSNYYALLHLARHEGIHAGGISTFCKLNGIKTV